MRGVLLARRGEDDRFRSVLGAKMAYVAEERFTVVYDGPALAEHRMDARELAFALLGVTDALHASSRVLDPDAPLPGLSIRAMEPGSFRVEMVLADPGVMDRVKDLFFGAGAVATTGEAIVTTAIAAILFVKRMRGRRIRSRQPVAPGMVRVVLDDGETIEQVPTAVVELFLDALFRQGVQRLTAPLTLEGVDNVTVVQGMTEVVRVERSERAAFDVQPAEVADSTVLVDSTREVVLRPATVDFHGGTRKWRVNDGDQELSVSVVDLAFLARVEANVESFTAGDVLRCDLRTIQRQTTDGAIRNEHTILRVHEHRPGPRQVPLPFESPPGDS